MFASKVGISAFQLAFHQLMQPINGFSAIFFIAVELLPYVYCPNDVHCDCNIVFCAEFMEFMYNLLFIVDNIRGKYMSTS